MVNVPEIRDIPRLHDVSASPNLNGIAILPAAAATTYSTAGINLSQLFSTVKGGAHIDAEIAIRVPDHTVAGLVNADTLKISVLLDVNATIDGSSVVYMLDVIDMLGAGGIGDLGEEVRVKIPSLGFLVNIAGTTLKYDYIGVSCIHTGTGRPDNVGGTGLGRCYCDLVF